MSLTKRCIFLKVNLNVYTVVIKFYRNYVTNSLSFLKVKKFWKFLRGGGSSKTPLERKILGGGGVQIKKSSVVGVWIFSGTTQSRPCSTTGVINSTRGSACHVHIPLSNAQFHI